MSTPPAAARRPFRLGLLLVILAATGIGGYVLLAGLLYAFQDAFIYPAPSGPPPEGLAVWSENGEVIGYERPALAAHPPRAVWLVMQGNGSAAGQRGYFAQIPPTDALHVLEYPGYGARPGTPNETSINAAATAAYQSLRKRYPGVPVGVIGESFGSGPACFLTAQDPAPDSVTLIVPLADFREAIGRLLRLPGARWLVRDQWDNRARLRTYAGPVAIYAAEHDEVLPRSATESLAASNPRIRLVWLPGGHTAPGDAAVIRLGD